MTASTSNTSDELLSAISSSYMTTNVDFDACSDHIVDSLKRRWSTVVCPPLFRNDTSACWWNRIVNLYSTPDRRYHTLVHLFEMVGYLDLVQQSTNPVMILAVFFHDAIYDAKSATNEEDSANLFREFCEDMQCGDEEIASNVINYILATKSHIIPKDDCDPNIALFLDIDMAVLGKDEPAYLHYASLIRQEYIFVDRSIYCEKRADILSTFLAARHIFVSILMRKALESKARENLSTEIELLKAGVIPGEVET